MYKQKHFLGFTLVELIVVITIVGILSTVGFVSYSGYLTGARDSNRISQLTKLSDSLQVYAATKSLPLPDNYVEITASGASNTIAYQGELGVDVLESIDYTNGGTDPKDESYYSYYLTKDRKSMQLMAMMEKQSLTVQNISNTSINLGDVPLYARGLLLGDMKLNAADYEDRYPKTYGSRLGILTQNITNTPVQDVTSIRNDGYIDIFHTNEIYTAHFGYHGAITGTGRIVGNSVLGKGRLVGYWDFDNYDGVNVMDVSGNSNNGVLSGSTIPTSIGGHHGNALDFSSADEFSGGYIEVPGSDDVDSEQFTISMWVKPSADAIANHSRHSQLVKNFVNDVEFNERTFVLTWDHKLSYSKTCVLAGSSGSNYFAQIKTSVDINIWNHIVCSFDGNQLTVYLNGKQEDSKKVSSAVLSGEGFLKIGAGGNDPTITSNYFDGSIDEVLFFKRGLSQRDVQFIYNGGL